MRQLIDGGPAPPTPPPTRLPKSAAGPLQLPPTQDVVHPHSAQAAGYNAPRLKTRLLTVAAAASLLLCILFWIRSYLPDYWIVRAHRGSLLVVFYGRDHAIYIDPEHHPSGGAAPRRRWDTEQTLNSARGWADGITITPMPASWRGAGFELIFNRVNLAQGYFVLGLPFWLAALALAGATAWGAVHWHRSRARLREGHCRACGYDLRGSSGTCPECGADAPSTIPIATTG